METTIINIIIITLSILSLLAILFLIYIFYRFKNGKSIKIDPILNSSFNKMQDRFDKLMNDFENLCDNPINMRSFDNWMNRFNEYTLSFTNPTYNEDESTIGFTSLSELKNKKPLSICIKYNDELQYFINGKFCKEYNISCYSNSMLNPLIYNNKYLKKSDIPKFILHPNAYCKVNSKTYPDDEKSIIYILIEKYNIITFYVISNTEEKKDNIMKEIQDFILKQVKIFDKINNDKTKK